MQKFLLTIVLGLCGVALMAAKPATEVISFGCGLAIDATIAEMDKQSNNPVTREALSKIDENNGQFVCLPAGGSIIYVRLQSVDMTVQDNKLLFTIDTRSYRVVKTQYGM